MSIAQIIILLIIANYLFRVFRSYMKRKIGSQDVILWTILWGVIAVVVIRPELSTVLANKVGIGRGVDFMTYLSLLFLFYMTFHFNRKTLELEEMITKLGREIAISNAKDYTQNQESRTK